MTNEYFNTKEDYLLFRKQFAAAVNHNNAKSHLEPCDEWHSEEGEYSKGTGTHRIDGWMTAAHFIFLNIARTLPPKRGFTSITNKIKLANSTSEWQGFNDGANKLLRLSKLAKTTNAQNITGGFGGWQEKELYEFFKPLIEAENSLAKRYEEVLGKNNPLVERYMNILAKMPMEGLYD